MRAQRILRKYLVLGVLAGFFAGCSALAADTPETLQGVVVVSADEVLKLHAAGVAVIDARVAAEYAEAHIKGAINVPYREKSAKAITFDPSHDQFNLAKLPADKAEPIVLYCNGPECWKSFKACTAAIKAGYREIKWYRAGFPDWQARGLPTE
jgi:rhodanese-related sulfurtransferase